ncbi:MAG: hypothetical protein LBP54_03665 [Campylobacteraceae bacterium]|jgi:hypothetical protein|nr:hypothetical protein [Campylobacteraceae bacterium]
MEILVVEGRLDTPEIIKILEPAFIMSNRKNYAAKTASQCRIYRYFIKFSMFFEILSQDLEYSS